MFPLNYISADALMLLAGYLARHILEYFRGSLVERIDLSPSLSDEDGLNQLKPQFVLESEFHINISRSA
jgi:hypothetical protein